MEGKSGPRRWVGRKMMDSMKNSKQAWMMHSAMGPIEIGVMDQQHQNNTKEKITQAVFIKLSI
jgi:hypothetical protein